jgi:hypothetical protein
MSPAIFLFCEIVVGCFQIDDGLLYIRRFRKMVKRTGC